MKYIKKFEMDSYLRREIGYKNYFFNNKDAEKIENAVKEFIKDINITEKIDDLGYYSFVSGSYSAILYKDIFYMLISGVYQVIDTFCKEEDIVPSITKKENSTDSILKKCYNEFKIKSQLDKKLIEIFEKHPDKYKNLIKRNYPPLGHLLPWQKEISYNVRKTCQWILDAEKYNI